MRSLLLKTASAALVCLTLGSGAALAHHAFASEFDANRPVVLRGKVTRIEWVNPHAWIHIDQLMADGSVQQWRIEGGTPNALLRRGITKDSLKLGDQVVVHGFQSKDGLCNPTCRATGRDVTFLDGRKLLLGPASGSGQQDSMQESKQPK